LEIALFQTPAKYGALIRGIMYGLPLVMLVAGALLWRSADREGSYAMLATAALIFLLMQAVMPRRFEVYGTRLRVVLGGPFAFNIPFAEITAVVPVSPSLAFVHGGLRLTTAADTAVVVKRRRRLDVVVSPADRDGLIQAFEQARQ